MREGLWNTKGRGKKGRVEEWERAERKRGWKVGVTDGKGRSWRVREKGEKGRNFSVCARGEKGKFWERDIKWEG